MKTERIWDLRRGDYDDNRTSSHVRGLGSLALFSLQEFNFLNASLSFLTLILGPALVLGLVPSIVVTYGLLKFEALSLTGRSPILALVVLAALLGLALWLGRPFFRWVLESFRALHYALVFPIFIIVQEIFRMIAERVPKLATNAAEIDRRRRLGTIVAALLVAVAGVGLAAGVSLSLGARAVDLRRVPPWTIVRAALINAAVLFGLSAAVESLYWLLRQRALGTVLDWSPAASRADGPRFRIAHVSDLHLVGERYGYRMETGTHGPRGNERFGCALLQLAALHSAAPLDHIFITGDLTDAGTRAEWAEFLDWLEGYPELRERLSFVPGNHDLNVVDRSNPGRLDLPWSAGIALRQLRVVLAMDAIQGERTYLVEPDSGNLGPSLHAYLRTGERLERLRALAERGAIRGRLEMARTWEALFPLVEPAPTKERGGIILLNSNSRASFALTNAVGVVAPAQLRALRALLRAFPERHWAVLLHHPLVEFPVTSIKLRDRIALALINAPQVMAALSPYAGRLLVFHGHRHWDWIGTCGKVVLCSAPSVTLGARNRPDGHGVFHLHEVTVGEDFQIIATERVAAADRVSAQGEQRDWLSIGDLEGG